MSKRYSFYELETLWLVKHPPWVSEGQETHASPYQAIDIKPYPLRPNSIIVFLENKAHQTSGPVEVAYEYREDKDRFVWIPNAKKYKEILNDIYPTPLKDLVEHKKEEWL